MVGLPRSDEEQLVKDKLNGNPTLAIQQLDIWESETLVHLGLDGFALQ